MPAVAIKSSEVPLTVPPDIGEEHKIVWMNYCGVVGVTLDRSVEALVFAGLAINTPVL